MQVNNLHIRINIMKSNLTNRKLTWILVFVFILISFFPLFAFLGTLPLRTWDESRLAASAYEMTQTKNPLVVTFDYQPDHWSVKPPLNIWAQAISIKLFGVNETAVRLPSALSIMFLGIILIFLTSKINRPWIGFYASVIIICSKGILYYHCGRNADYDAMLSMLVIAYSMSIFVFSELKEKKYYIFFFIFLVLAALTKGVQALIPLPFIFLYIVLRKDFIALLKNKLTYIGIGLFLVVIGGYYFGREYFDNGYLKAVYENELGGRYLKTLEGHHGEYDYYFIKLRDELFTYFIWIVPFSFVFNLFNKDKTSFRLSNYAFGIAITIFIVISIGKTKLTWYAFPLLPLLAIVLGTSFATIHSWLLGLKTHKALTFSILLIGFVAIFYTPYKEIVNHVYKPKESDWFVPYYSRFEIIKKIIDKELVFNDTVVYINHDNQQDFFFYIYAMNHYGILNDRKEVKQLKVGEIVQINEPNTDQQVMEIFEYDTLYHSIQSKVVKLTALKENKK